MGRRARSIQSSRRDTHRPPDDADRRCERPAPDAGAGSGNRAGDPPVALRAADAIIEGRALSDQPPAAACLLARKKEMAARFLAGARDGGRCAPISILPGEGTRRSGGRISAWRDLIPPCRSIRRPRRSDQTLNVAADVYQASAAARVHRLLIAGVRALRPRARECASGARCKGTVMPRRGRFAASRRLWERAAQLLPQATAAPGDGRGRRRSAAAHFSIGANRGPTGLGHAGRDCDCICRALGVDPAPRSERAGGAWLVDRDSTEDVSDSQHRPRAAGVRRGFCGAFRGLEGATGRTLHRKPSPWAGTSPGRASRIRPNLRACESTWRPGAGHFDGAIGGRAPAVLRREVGSSRLTDFQDQATTGRPHRQASGNPRPATAPSLPPSAWFAQGDDSPPRAAARRRRQNDGRHLSAARWATRRHSSDGARENSSGNSEALRREHAPDTRQGDAQSRVLLRPRAIALVRTTRGNATSRLERSRKEKKR